MEKKEASKYSLLGIQEYVERLRGVSYTSFEKATSWIRSKARYAILKLKVYVHTHKPKFILFHQEPSISCIDNSGYIALPRNGGRSVDAKCLCISTGPPAGTVARIGHHSGTHTHTHANGHDHDLGKGQARVSHSSPLFISSSTRPILRKLPNQKHRHA